MLPLYHSIIPLQQKDMLVADVFIQCFFFFCFGLKIVLQNVPVFQLQISMYYITLLCRNPMEVNKERAECIFGH